MARRRLRDKRYDSARWQRLRRAAIIRDGGRCSVPGCRADVSRPRSLHVDHVVEVNDGGSFWSLANLQSLCSRHHFAKTMQVMADRSVAEPVEWPRAEPRSEDW
jgi:5-methylcytosine-specific restriction endonuclease McrA